MFEFSRSVGVWMKHPVVAAFLALAVLSVAAHGWQVPAGELPDSSAAGPTPGSEPPDAQSRVAQELTETEFRASWFLGSQISHPQKFSASVGWIRSRQPTAYECGTVCDFHGWTVAVEPGLGGGKVSAGFARFMASRSEARKRLERIYLGLGGRVALLRTWGDANLDPVDRSFAGIEGTLTVTQVQVNLGLFRRISSANDADRWMVSVGLGYGF